jgi:hypothetical protein
MFLKKVPPINIVLFFIMSGVITAAIIGVIRFVKSNDNPNDNYVEATYNVPLSKHYTDSLSHTPLGELGKIEILIYDSVENKPWSFVICKIKNDHEAFSYYEVEKRSITTLLTLFPHEAWYSEVSYSISEPNSWRNATFGLPYQIPETFSEESPWDD